MKIFCWTSRCTYNNVTKKRHYESYYCNAYIPYRINNEMNMNDKNICRKINNFKNSLIKIKTAITF